MSRADLDIDPYATPDECGRCDGGWVAVAESYVERVGKVQPEAAANTVYPCRECRPDAFLRWAEGHYRADRFGRKAGVGRDQVALWCVR